MNFEDIEKLVYASDYMVRDCKIVYTLRECLESSSDFELELIYNLYEDIGLVDKKRKKKLSKEAIIDFLEKQIPFLFEQQMAEFIKNEIEALNEILHNQTTEKTSVTFLGNGFMFGFKENGKNVYVVPNELLHIYQTYINSDKKKEDEIEKVKKYISSYLLINCLVSIERVQDIIINKYGINVTKEEINDIVTEQFTIYKDKYYCFINVNEKPNNELNILFEKIIEKEFDYLSEYELLEYLEMMTDLILEVNEIIGPKDTNYVLNRLLIIKQPIEDILDRLNLTESKYEKLYELLAENESDIRYWMFNGKTAYEADREYLLNNVAFDKKPKFNDLTSCLKHLSESTKTNILTYLGEEELTEEVIIKAFMDEVSFYTPSDYLDIMRMNHKEINSFIDNDLINCGGIFLYEEDDKIKCLIPDEILEILEKNAEASFVIEDLVSTYLNMNGFIKKDKLKELLHEYHDVDVTIEELDNIVKIIEAKEVASDYYTWVLDAEQSDVDDMMEVKNLFGEYKKANMEYETCEDIFKEELRKILVEEISSDDELYFCLISVIKGGAFNKELFNFILDDFDISLKESSKRKILDLYKEYKKYISVWSYNGYTASEFASINQSKSSKIGRNEPCPCGSGKKYKKCCGK